jgi:hypothetical protein
MARPRSERSESEWLEFGHILVEYLKSNKYKTDTPRLQLRNKTQMLLNELEDVSSSQDQNELIRIIKALNSLNYDYGDVWKIWIKKLSQYAIDKKRVRIDTSVDAHNYFKDLMKSENFNSNSLFYAEMIKEFKELGISKIDQVRNIRQFLFQYQDHTKKLKNVSLNTKDDTAFDVEMALNAIVGLLKKREINSFHQLNEALSNRVKENNIIKKYKHLESYYEKQGLDINELIKKERGF